MNSNSSFEVRLTPEQKMVADLLIKSGLLEDADVRDANKRREDRELREKYYHDAQALLKNYRKCVWALNLYPAKIEESLTSDLKETDTLISAVDSEFACGNKRLEAIVENYKKVRANLDRVLEAVTVLKEAPDFGLIYYDILANMYIVPQSEALSPEQIMRKYSISRSSFYRYRNDAIEIVSCRLWGIANKKFAVSMDAIECFAKFSAPEFDETDESADNAESDEIKGED